MAEILRFPRKMPSDLINFDSDDWLEDAASGGVDLGSVAELAAAPSRTLADLAHKAEVLVLRLLPDDEAEAGLCAAEAALLRSMACEIRKIADAFATRDMGLLLPVVAE